MGGAAQLAGAPWPQALGGVLEDTLGTVQLLPHLGWQTCPSAHHRASGCPLPASGLGGLSRVPTSLAWGQQSRGRAWEFWVAVGPQPEFRRSAEATEPWQGPLAQIRGCGGWGGWAGPQPTSGAILCLSFVLSSTPSQKTWLAGGRSHLGILGQGHRDKAGSHRLQHVGSTLE